MKPVGQNRGACPTGLSRFAPAGHAWGSVGLPAAKARSGNGLLGSCRGANLGHLHTSCPFAPPARSLERRGRGKGAKRGKAVRQAANVRLHAERPSGKPLEELARADESSGGNLRSASKRGTPIELRRSPSGMLQQTAQCDQRPVHGSAFTELSPERQAPRQRTAVPATPRGLVPWYALAERCREASSRRADRPSSLPAPRRPKHGPRRWQSQSCEEVHRRPNRRLILAQCGRRLPGGEGFSRRKAPPLPTGL